jgi:acyl phosphate:glycerol-3-phosphate acyltransferase
MSSTLLLGLAVTLGAYLLGSVSTAIVVCRLAGLPDPRTQGSGNPGATNVLRLGGRAPAAATLAGDFLKGLVPVLAARALGLPDAWVGAAMLGAFFGHLYPLYFGFQGGKGVATQLGVLAGMAWPVGLATALTWATVAAALRYSSLAALISAWATPAYTLWRTDSPALTLATLVIAAVITWRHRANIARLRAGTEPRIGRKAEIA